MIDHEYATIYRMLPESDLNKLEENGISLKQLQQHNAKA